MRHIVQLTLAAVAAAGAVLPDDLAGLLIDRLALLPLHRR